MKRYLGVQAKTEDSGQPVYWSILISESSCKHSVESGNQRKGSLT